MHRALLPFSALLAGFGLALPLTGTATAPPAPSCGQRSAGPGALVRGTNAGAECMLAAFEQHCRPASYELSVFGVDTIARDSFSLRARGARCEVELVASFEVVPRLRSSHSAQCSALVRQGSQIIASGCLGAGVPRQVSLTGPG
jgi:hypothetical protein